jgi:NAD(P)H-hydrate repair Nnr-like enzyme with NAD(P)H-hydrate dehydratase domain
LLGQGMGAFEAAVLGVFVHGRAGDMAAANLTEISLMATDLIDWLSEAWASLDE